MSKSKDVLGKIVRLLVAIPSCMLGIVHDLLEKFSGEDGTEWAIELGKFLRKEPTWQEATKVVKAVKKVLELIGSVGISAVSTFSTKDHFKVGKDGIGWISSVFDEWFGEKIEEPIGETNISFHKLKKASVDGPIITELGGEEKVEVSLGQIRGLIEKRSNGQEGVLLTNGWANIFYVRDCQGVLRTVRVRWSSAYGFWFVYACSIDYPYEWYEGYRFFSRNS